VKGTGDVLRFRERNYPHARLIYLSTHVVDTMALSSFALRNDGFFPGTEGRCAWSIPGFGPGCTWQLHLPKRASAFNFRRIFDVNLVLCYNPQFDNALRSMALAMPAAGRRDDPPARVRNVQTFLTDGTASSGSVRQLSSSMRCGCGRISARHVEFRRGALAEEGRRDPGRVRQDIPFDFALEHSDMLGKEDRSVALRKEQVSHKRIEQGSPAFVREIPTDSTVAFFIFTWLGMARYGVAHREEAALQKDRVS
jgi:hypothetical protein